jgi:hypothetical protein
MTPLSAREVRRLKAAAAGPLNVIADMPQGSFLTRRANKSNAAA